MIVMFGDLHLDNFRQFSTITPKGLNSRLVIQSHVVGQVVKLVEKFKKEGRNPHIVFTGDIINSQGESLHKMVYRVAYYTAKRLAAVAPTYMICGNHDIYRNIDLASNFDAVQDLWGVRVTAQVPLDGHTIDLVPWECNIPKRNRGDILIGHIPLIGDEFGNVFDKDGISRDELIGYKKIFLGHYHTRREFKVKGADYATYIGAVMANSFSDSNEQRGITVLDDDEVRFIPIESPQFIERRVSSVEHMDKLRNEWETSEDFFKVTVMKSGIPIPALDHRAQFETDYQDVEIVTRLSTPEKHETLQQSVHRVVDLTNTALDRDEIKKELDQMMKGVWDA